jgi:DNA-binding transcriptional LysR family regulator
LDVDALKTFLEVNRTRHFGQAADNLYLSQSAVSARIRMLEQEVGVPLFTRQRNNIQLTAAGQRLLQYAENILTTWHRAKQEIGTNDASQIPFTIGIMPSLWDILLQPWIGYMQETLPELILHAESNDPIALLRRIKEGTMDLAFCFDYPQSSDVEIVEVMQIPLVLVSSTPGLTVEQALSKDYMLVDWGTSFANAHAHHFANMPAAHMRLAFGRMAKDLMLSHGGSAYLGEPMVQDEIRKKKLFRIKSAPTINRGAYAAYSRDNEKSATIQHALKYFEKNRVQTAQAV